MSHRLSLRPTLAAAGLIALAAIGWSTPASGQQLVYDPTNHAENVLTAARALEQIRNQVRQIEQQAKMLEASPLELSPELARSIEEARALFDAAKGLAYDIDRIGSEIEALYPRTWEAYDLEAILGQSDLWLDQSRQSLSAAMTSQARAAQSLAGSRDRLRSALVASAAAPGGTAAAQAGNQIAGVTAAELAEIHALLIAQGRALETERMERIARETRAEEIRKRAFPSDRPAAPPPARSAF